MSIGTHRLRWISAPLLIFLLALLLRIGLIAAKPNLDASERLDSYRYTLIAHSLVSGRGFTLEGSPSLNRGPAYPAFIATIYRIFGEDNLAVKIAQAILGALIPLVLFQITLLLYTRRIALLAALLAAVELQLIGIIGFRYPETLFTLMELLAIWAVMVATRKKSIPGMALSGVILCLGAFVRSLLAAMPVVIFLAFVLWRIPWKQCLLWSIVITVAMCSIMAPWSIRNYNVSGRFIPVTTGLGYVLWVGNYLPLDGRDRHDISRRIMWKMTRGMDAAEADAFLTRQAVRGIVDQPLPSAWLMLRKTGRFWFDVYASSPVGDEAPRNNMIAAVFVADNTALMLFAFLGIVFSRRKLRSPSLVIGVILLAMLTAVVTIPVARFRTPVMPLVCMFAAVGLCRIWDGLKAKSETRPT